MHSFFCRKNKKGLIHYLHNFLQNCPLIVFRRRWTSQELTLYWYWFCAQWSCGELLWEHCQRVTRERRRRRKMTRYIMHVSYHSTDQEEYSLMFILTMAWCICLYKSLLSLLVSFLSLFVAVCVSLLCFSLLLLFKYYSFSFLHQALSECCKHCSDVYLKGGHGQCFGCY